MNSTALLFNGAFKMSVEQQAEAPRQKDSMAQHRDDDIGYAQLVNDIHNEALPTTVPLMLSRSDASVSEWVAAVTMGKFALGQFATNINKTATTKSAPVAEQYVAAAAAAQPQRAMSSPSQAMLPKPDGLLSSRWQPMAALSSQQVAASFSAATVLPALPRKIAEVKPPMTEKIAPRLVRILERDNSATLYIRDYLHTGAQLQRDVGVLLQALGADNAYQHVVINGINQPRTKL